MDEVTQQNSALVEENAATAKTLEHQAKAMDERVAFFQIDGAGAQASPVAQKHASAPRAVEARQASLPLRRGAATARLQLFGAGQ